MGALARSHPPNERAAVLGLLTPLRQTMRAWSGSLSVRIALAFSLLLLIVQAAALVLVNTVVTQSTHDGIERDLSAGQGIFESLRKQDDQHLAEAASLLSADFGFRQAIGTGDRNTIASALANSASRIDAGLGVLVGLDGTVLADTESADRVGKPFAFLPLIRDAAQSGRAMAVVSTNGRGYELVVVPVLAPIPIAWLAMGIAIDERFVARLKAATALEVSFWSQSAASAPWSLLAATMASPDSAALQSALSQARSRDASMSLIAANSEDYVTRVVRPGSRQDGNVVTVLQKSLTRELAPLRRLQQILLCLGLVSLIATLGSSVVLSRSMTRPITELSAAAQKIEQGDYANHIAPGGRDELGRLAAAFQQMQEGIAARESKIVELAYHDPLTGLPNRALLCDRLQQAIHVCGRLGNPPAVLVMDLDRFKDINDALGHPAGDQLLQRVAKRLSAIVPRKSDTVARLGGDEFAILLPMCSVEYAQAMARKVMKNLQEPFFLAGQPVSIDASIGIARYPDHGQDVHNLMRCADIAMYVAKRQGGGVTIYDPDEDNQGRERLSLLADLRRALEHNELLLYYQPKIDMAAGRVVGVEALLRWLHPQRGLVSPDEFIPFAENTGFIRSITRWVIATALEQRSLWHAAGLNFGVSINLSARDLLNPRLDRLFAQLMQEHHATPDWLALEVTESAVMTDPDQALKVLESLRELGLRLSIDDFGTGYSSLAYLKKLPFDELKIDKSFVRDMKSDADDAAIVRSTIDLAHNMGLEVVAEGVEDAETFERLRSLGCNIAQGYVISRPLPSQQLQQWMLTWPGFTPANVAA
jgi:diguanylate cyclase (GGDEF)-like protein